MSTAADIPEPSDIVNEVQAMTPEISSGRNLGLVFGGFVIGAGVGAAVSFVLTRRILETKYNKISEEEIAVMREHYQNKMMALDNTAEKPNLEDIVEERGYSVPVAENRPPMAVSPPTSVVEAAEEDLEEVEVAPTPVVEVKHEKTTRNVFEEAQAADTWDWYKEKAKRSPVRPYVIHMDEREGSEYDEITLTYYEADDVLCDERDEALSGPDRERMVGEANLDKFGHGSNDPSIVYVRNDRLETQYEIVQSSNSYAEEVHGFEHADNRRHRRERKFSDDE